MIFVKLVAKTNKGKNKLNEAGNPDQWLVVEIRATVAFSDRQGPWYHVRPEHQDMEKSRWVNTVDDFDFIVKQV